MFGYTCTSRFHLVSQLVICSQERDIHVLAKQSTGYYVPAYSHTSMIQSRKGVVLYFFDKEYHLFLFVCLLALLSFDDKHPRSLFNASFVSHGMLDSDRTLITKSLGNSRQIGSILMFLWLFQIVIKLCGMSKKVEICEYIAYILSFLSVYTNLKYHASYTNHQVGGSPSFGHGSQVC